MNIIKKRKHQIFDLTVQGLTFQFRSLTHKEKIQLVERREFSHRIDLIVGSILKITPDKFEDGSTIDRSTIFELDDLILADLYNAWAKKKNELDEQEAKERLETAAFTQGSPSASTTA